MELLYAIKPPVDDRQCDLAAWLRPGEHAMKAALQFRALCRRSHLVGFFSDHRPRAIYWRHLVQHPKPGTVRHAARGKIPSGSTHAVR